LFPSMPLRHAIFDTTFSIFELWSRSWDVNQLLGFRGIPPRYQSLERGRVAPPTLGGFEMSG